MGDIYFPSILWKEHHPIILNSVHNSDLKEFVCEHNEHGSSNVHKTTDSVSDVLDSLKTIKLCKAAIIDAGAPNSAKFRGGGVAEGHPRFDKGGVAIKLLSCPY